MTGKPNYSLGELTVFPEAMEVLVSGKRIKMEPKIMALLNYFAARPNQVLAKEQILKDVWPGTIVVDEALHRAVSILRKTLGDNQENRVFVETISKKGYRFLVAATPTGLEKEDDVKPTKRTIKLSPPLIMLLVLAGAIGSFLIWRELSVKPFVPTAESPAQLPSEEPAPPAPEPENAGNEGV